MTALVQSAGRGGDRPDVLRSRVSQLEAELSERDAEAARVQGDLAAFRLRYRQEVGLLHEQLDELELAITQVEVGVIVARLDSSARDSNSSPPDPPQPRLTSDAVRRLFRDVARVIHPDLASDDDTKDRRHRLMVEANRAYALGDGERLRSILDAWQRSPEAVQGSDDEATRLRLVRRIAQVQEQLDACNRELSDLKESPLWKLKVLVDAASKRGKDLVADMVRRLERDILVARNRLDAIQPGPGR